MTTKETIANANSKGLILDYYSTPSNNQYSFGRKSDFDLRKALNVIKNDPVVKGAMITMVDKVMETPWQLVGRDKRSRKSELEKKLRDLRFSKLLRKIVFNLVLYGNCFVEVVKQGGKVTDLNVLETINTDIKCKDNGDVTSYIQTVGKGTSKNPITWNPERIVHFKLSEITTNVWGEVDLQSVYDTILIKDAVREWIRWFFQTNQARGFYNIKSANREKVKDFLANLKANEVDKSKPVIAQGEIVYQLLRNFGDETKTLNDLLLWLDNQILALLNVPPIAMGFPDMSGRSNSVEQFRSLNIRVNSFHEIIEDYVTYDLFPKIGFEKVELEFGAIDDMTLKSKMEVVTLMRNANFTNEAIEEWLNEQNIFFKTKKLFEEPMEMENDKVQGEFAPSRMRKGEGEPNKQKDEVSTRDDQLVKNSVDKITMETDQWRKY